MSPRARATWIALATIALTGLVAASARRTDAPAPAAARFPVQRLAPGDVPALWVFVRRECPACRRHVHALHDALARLDVATRARVAARLHLVGDVPCSAVVHRHARSWLRALGVTTTPLTWWVAADSSIARTWRGPRDVASWQHAFGFTLGDTP